MLGTGVCVLASSLNFLVTNSALGLYSEKQQLRGCATKNTKSKHACTLASRYRWWKITLFAGFHWISRIQHISSFYVFPQEHFWYKPPAWHHRGSVYLVRQINKHVTEANKKKINKWNPKSNNNKVLKLFLFQANTSQHWQEIFVKENSQKYAWWKLHIQTNIFIFKKN